MFFNKFCSFGKSNVATIDARDIQFLNNATIIDVRMPSEFLHARIDSSINIPLERINDEASRLNKNSTIVLCCRGGNISKKAYNKLTTLGFHDIVYLKGGLTNWVRSGFELVGARTVFTISQQTQIIIGSCMLFITDISLITDIRFFFFNIVLGFGTAFAGLFDAGLLERLLYKAYWNKPRVAVEVW